MTVCVALLCEEARSMVLVSDKMIGRGYIEGEPEVEKIVAIHPFWYMMMSGDDISPLFELADLARSELPITKRAPLHEVMEVMERNYAVIRSRRAEAEHLRPISWTTERFIREGASLLPNYREIQANIFQYELQVDLIVAGFDAALNPPGKLFTVSSQSRGVATRCDIPGFATIGSGGIGAEFMLYFKDVSPKLPLRAAVYYALEAKYFGEQATGVGGSTDMYILRFDGTSLVAKKLDDEKTIEEKLIPICQRLEPRHPTDRDRKILNSLPELEGLPLLPLDAEKKAKTSSESKPDEEEKKSVEN